MIDRAWECELMWAAGFFDGEGNIDASRGLRVQISQRHRQPLDRFAAALATGKVYEYERGGRPLYAYAASGFDAEWVGGLLLDRVSEIKRQQIIDALALHDRRSRFMGDQHRAKMSAAARVRGGRPRTDEERAQISASHKRVERGSQCA